MKNFALIISSLLLATSAFASETYHCYSAGKNKDDGYFKSSEQYGVLTLNKSSARLQVVDKSDDNVASTYVYKIVGPSEERGSVAGMIKAELNFDKSKYSGDAIDSIYIDESLLEGGARLSSGKKGGKLVFAGHGYAWDWNLCVNAD